MTSRNASLHLGIQSSRKCAGTTMESPPRVANGVAYVGEIDDRSFIVIFDS
jgi:hypothetical protein